jgi:hypothetical protein
MDVKSAFLNGVLKEVYVEQPLGYMKLEKEHKVLRLGIKMGHTRRPFVQPIPDLFVRFLCPSCLGLTEWT